MKKLPSLLSVINNYMGYYVNRLAVLKCRNHRCFAQLEFGFYKFAVN